MGTVETRSGAVAFRPRARLLKLIGAELISNEVVALVELVKNSHDADASKVEVSFSATSSPEGEIVVRDDGSGMDLDTLMSSWMEPAGSSKRGASSRTTSRGRRVLGEKGVGRFAADKLGSRLELISRTEGSPTEVRAVFDWDKFDTDLGLLADVENEWEERPAREITGHGTILRISGLRARWTERMFHRLSVKLARLRTPFGGFDSFAILVDSDEFPEYGGEVRSALLEKAPYSIDASFDGNQTVTCSLAGEAPTQHAWNGSNDLACGPVRVRLFAFDLETEALAKLGPRVEVRAWLKDCCGVSIYRDAFRVWPYGEPHDDWLRLDQRRVNNPTVKLSNNQIVGFVEITGDGNPDLVDQTNRQGLIQNRAMEDLRRLVVFVLQLLESRRQTIRNPRERRNSRTLFGEQENTESPRGSDPIAILQKVSAAVEDKQADRLRRAAKLVEENLGKERQRTRLVEEGYSDLASLGLSALGFSGSVRPLITDLKTQLEALESRLKSSKMTLNSTFRKLQRDLALVEARVDMFGGMDAETGRSRRTIDLAAELDRCKALLRPMLEGRVRDLEIEVSGPRPMRTEMRPEVFQRVVHAIWQNSLDWFPGVKRPKLWVKVSEQGDGWEILFCDNGPGIPAELAERVFDPMFTGKEAGLGMGLTIVRSILERHGGKVEAVIDGRRRGATLRVALRRKRARSTAD